MLDNRQLSKTCFARGGLSGPGSFINLTYALFLMILVRHLIRRTRDMHQNKKVHLETLGPADSCSRSGLSVLVSLSNSRTISTRSKDLKGCQIKETARGDPVVNKSVVACFATHQSRLIGSKGRPAVDPAANHVPETRSSVIGRALA